MPLWNRCKYYPEENTDDWFLGDYHARHERPPQAIDTVDPELVGSLLTKKMKKWSAEAKEEWWTMCQSTIHPLEQHGWCGFDPKRETPPDLAAREADKAILDQIVGSIFEVVPKNQRCTRGMIMGSLFLVAKTPLLSRVILDCRLLNALCGKPPYVRFASLSDIFTFLDYFPTSFTITADFRHWFYQIPLSETLRHLFVVKTRGQMARLKAWAMGFSWSPFVAQSLSMQLGRLAIERVTIEGKQQWKAIPAHGVAGSSPPPFWIIVDVNADESNLKRDQVRGFLTFWYDNLFTVMGSPQDQIMLTTELRSVGETFKATWKPRKLLTTPPTDPSAIEHSEVQHPDPVVKHLFELAKDAANFLGIAFRRHREGWRWRHIPENIENWKETLITAPHSWRCAARIVGVLTWDWNVSNENRKAREDVFEIASIIGSRRLEGQEWDKTADPRVLTPNHWATLDRRTAELWTNPWRQHVPRRIHKISHIRFMCSDAMKSKGAALWFQARSHLIEKEQTYEFRHAPSHGNDEDSINWKETFTALSALNDSVDMLKPGMLKIIGIDNTTAVSVLNRRNISWCKDLDELLQAVIRKFHARGADFLPVYTPGTIQAADELSRGGTTNEGKAKECLTHLLNTKLPFWTRLESSLNEHSNEEDNL